MLILVLITNCRALLPTLNQPETISLSWQRAYHIQYCSAGVNIYGAVNILRNTESIL